MHIVDKLIICDATNNPATTCETVLNVTVHIQKTGGKVYAFNLPIDLDALEQGKLDSVPAESLGY
jgi:hypothetical protein